MRIVIVSIVAMLAAIGLESGYLPQFLVGSERATAAPLLRRCMLASPTFKPPLADGTDPAALLQVSNTINLVGWIQSVLSVGQDEADRAEGVAARIAYLSPSLDCLLAEGPAFCDRNNRALLGLWLSQIESLFAEVERPGRSSAPAALLQSRTRILKSAAQKVETGLLTTLDLPVTAPWTIRRLTLTRSAWQASRGDCS